jgi:hypothetical protein
MIKLLHILSLNIKINNLIFITPNANSKHKISLIFIQDGILLIRGKLGPCSGSFLVGECSVLLRVVECLYEEFFVMPCSVLLYCAAHTLRKFKKSYLQTQNELTQRRCV